MIEMGQGRAGIRKEGGNMMALDWLGVEAESLRVRSWALAQGGVWPPAAGRRPGAAALWLCRTEAAETQMSTKVLAVGVVRCCATSILLQMPPVRPHPLQCSGGRPVWIQQDGCHAGLLFGTHWQDVQAGRVGVRVFVLLLPPCWVPDFDTGKGLHRGPCI